MTRDEKLHHAMFAVLEYADGFEGCINKAIMYTPDELSLRFRMVCEAANSTLPKNLQRKIHYYNGAKKGDLSPPEIEDPVLQEIRKHGT